MLNFQIKSIYSEKIFFEFTKKGNSNIIKNALKLPFPLHYRNGQLFKCYIKHIAPPPLYIVQYKDIPKLGTGITYNCSGLSVFDMEHGY